MTQYPPHFMVVDEDGMPQGVVDVEQLRRDASLLAYQFAASSGDNAELDRLGVEWSRKLTGAYYGECSAERSRCWSAKSSSRC